MELRRSVITGETCACTSIMADRTALGSIRRPVARAVDLRTDASAGLPPPTHQRPDRLRQDAAAPAIRLLLPGEIADTTCSATTIRNRRDEWIRLGILAKLKQIALESYDRIVGFLLDQIAVDGSITKALGGGEAAGRSPVDRGKQGLKRSGMTDGYGIPPGRVLAGANRHDSPLLAPTLDRLDDLGPLPDDITVHLDAYYDSDKTRTLLDERGLHGRIAHRGEKAPTQASQRWHVERTHASQNAFHRLARCYERRATVINAFFDLADTIITVRSLIPRAWTTHRCEDRPRRTP